MNGIGDTTMAEADEAYASIFDEIVPEAIAFFKSKTLDYRGGPAFLLLGARGQFSDINRKFWKLYQAIWEGQELEGEQPEEIVKDFIGHSLLLLYCLREVRRAANDFGGVTLEQAGENLRRNLEGMQS
jgi:hypothetical protein